LTSLEFDDGNLGALETVATWCVGAAEPFDDDHVTGKTRASQALRPLTTSSQAQHDRNLDLVEHEQD